MATISEVRAKFPQYNDLSDEQLAAALHQKFYSDMPKAEFDRLVGLGAPAAAPAASAPKAEAPGVFQGVTDALGSGFSFGLQDEARAIGRAASQWAFGQARGEPVSYADAYAAAVEDERAKARAFAEANPVISGAANLVGGVASAAPARVASAVAAAPLTTAQAAKQAAISGAISGGVAGFGEGEGGLAPRLENAAQGAAVGGAVSGALVPVANAAVRGYQALGLNATERARAKLLQALKRDGMTPDDLLRNLDEMGPYATVVDAGGENTRTLGTAVASVPGKGKEAAQLLNSRLVGQGGRITEAAREGLNVPAKNFYATTAELEAQRAAAAKPLYEQAYAKPFVWSDKLEQMMKRPSMERALANAVRIAREEDVSPSALGLNFNEAGDVIFEKVPSMRTLDYIKRGLDDVLESTYRDKTTGRLVLDTWGGKVDRTRRELLAELDRLNPTYASARAAWSGPTDSKEAMALGREALDPSRASEITAKRIAALSPNDKEFFRLGVMRKIEEMVKSTPSSQDGKSGADAVKRIFGNAMIREKLALAFPSPAAFREFERQMLNEANFFNTRTDVLIGSRTRPLGEAINDLGSPDAAEAVDLALNAARGNVSGFVAQAERFAKERLTRPSQRVANELADTLYAPSGLARSQIEEALRRPPITGMPLTPEQSRLLGMIIGRMAAPSGN